MSKNAKLISKSDKAAFAALFGLVPIFIVIVTIGWKNILTNVIVIPDNSNLQITIQYTIAFFVSVVGLLLARGVAAERRKIKKGIELGPTTTWISYFFVLIIISALGTITTLFKVSEEKTIIKEFIKIAEHNIREFRTSVINDIKTPEYDLSIRSIKEDRKSVDDVFLKISSDLTDLYDQRKVDLENQSSDAQAAYNDFIREARNPQRPGFGPVARQNFEKLQKLIPIEPLSGGMNALKDKVIEEYDEKFKYAREKKFDVNKASCILKDGTISKLTELEQKVSSITHFVELQCGQISVKLTDIKKRIEDEFKRREPRLNDDEKSKLDFKNGLIDQFDKELQKLDENYNDINKISKETSGSILKTAWSKYSELRDQAINFVDPSVLERIPEKIDDNTIDNLGEITHTIDILRQRWDRFNTYFIVFFGIILDVVLIAFFARTISSLEDRDDEDPYGYIGSSSPSVKNLFNE